MTRGRQRLVFRIAGLLLLATLVVAYLQPEPGSRFLVALIGLAASFAVGTIVLPTLDLCLRMPRVLRRRRDRRRKAARRCRRCDYNLTGNVSGVCPECGRSVKR